MTEKNAWFLSLELDGKIGVGECSVIPKLSPDFENKEQYERLLDELIREIDKVDWISVLEKKSLLEVKEKTNLFDLFHNAPSILFGLETALLDLFSDEPELFFNNAFSRGELQIPINGLLWMGSRDFLMQQIAEKKEQGFTCLKMKVGAIDFDQEMDILAFIRSSFPPDLILRVDANGAFSETDVREKLSRLKDLNIHSIEQPIPPGQTELMSALCTENTLPVALDEELIGINHLVNKVKLLDLIRPQYIILKPSLHGGILGCEEWIQLAEERNIDWWLTSALESNVGLNCIAQFTANYPINKHHGLGTGSLYVKNTPTNLYVKNGFLSLVKS